MRIVALAATLACIAMVAAAAWLIWLTPRSILTGAAPDVTVPRPHDTATAKVNVRQGESPKSIGDQLQRAGVVQSGQLFYVVSALEGAGASLQAGDYEFEKGLPAVEVVDRIRRGITAPLQVSIPEGLQSGEIADLLQREGVVDRGQFLAALQPGNYDLPFIKQLPAGAPLEGFLFPATYGFSSNAPPDEVVRRLLQGFQDSVAGKISLEGSKLDLLEVVTLASIVEREAAVASERPIIASVFLNRLQAGLPLQADPTVQYALASDPASVRDFGYWKKALTESDLQVDSPYNTYEHVGLPPGPIANPGLASIQAVLQPADTNYLFFVAKPDGTHAFATTLAEHEQNVQQYQGGGQ